MRKAIQILLFIISYAPLYIILTIQNINDVYCVDGKFIGYSQLCYNNRVSIILSLMTIFSVVAYFVLYQIVLKSSTVKVLLKSKIENNEEHLSYLATYILPFVGLSFDTWQTVAASVVLFYVLGVVYIRTNLILTNPTLTFFGFFISNFETNNKTCFIIHKENIFAGNEINCVHLINNIYIKK